jgi:hypothetical protein
MFTPSIYQFVTAAKDSSEESEKNGSNTLWPGLNGTERDYALVSVSFALFETVLFPLPMLMMDSLPFTLLMLLTFSLFTVAGVVYGCATHIWMVFVARGLMGAAALFASSIIYTYTGEIGSIMDMERLKMGKKPIKGSLYLAITFTTHGYHIILLGINAGLVRIPSVNPYRLPGWFLAALGVTAAIIVLLFFSETRPWTCRFKSSCDITSGWSDFRKMRSKSKSYLIGVAFVFANAYVTGQAFALLYTLVSPILSDQFGFTVDNTALFFTALAVGGLASPFVQFCSQALKCNNRVRMAFALVTIVIGNTLISDWQVLYYKENPCYLPSPGDNGTTDVVDGNNITSSFENINDHINSTFEWNIDNCEGKSTSNHECFWNPSSRVTGDHCHTCHNACLSKQAFLNFYQFNIGVLFLSVGATLAYVFNFALLSDIVPPENQVNRLTIHL